YFGANSAHPFENPNFWSNLIECVAILLLPVASLVMFGRMLGNKRHAAVIAGVMALLFFVLVGWAIYWDTLQPNPALTEQPARTIDLRDADDEPVRVQIPARVALPVDQKEGNLEGKENRFGTAAGTTWATATTCTSNGSVNSMHDSLNPLAAVTPLTGMWLNCIFGGKGVGLINLLVYLIVAVFLA